MAGVVGIDLGTTFTVVAAIVDGRARVLPNAEGQHLTPSVVAFTSGGEPLVGETAKRQATINPDGTVFSIKRHMGSSHKVSATDKEYSPQEISSLILRKVKADAEECLGERIDRAVITVPAYANDRHRQATREAARLAGLEVMRLINEPTAAALAYGLLREDAHTVLVWDLGGGTFDVSVLELGDGVIEVKAVSGDSWLGGDDFDSRVVDLLAQGYRRCHGTEFPTEPAPRRMLREAAERAKIQLSSLELAVVRVPLPGPGEGRSLEVDLTRVELERVTAHLLDRMVVCVEQALKDANLVPEEIDRVLLVGGATRMPAVRALVRKVIRKEPYRYIDPDEVVAVGAAIQSGMLLGVIEKVALLDVLPLSLGVESQGGLMARVIPRNTPLPASEGRIFTTAQDYQACMDIHVLQGERELAVDNISLGQFQLTGIPPAARGVSKVEIEFEADVDGIVHISAKDLLAGSEMEVTTASTKLLDRDEIQRLIEEARFSANQDMEQREGIEARIRADSTIAAAEIALKDLVSAHANLPVRQVTEAISKVNKALTGGTSKRISSTSNELLQLLSTLAKKKASASNLEVRH